MKSANKILISASTLSWIATYLGDANEVHIPYNSYHGGYEGTGPHLGSFNNKCIVYNDMKYYKF